MSKSPVLTELRAHHLLCALTFRRRGYGPDFIERFDQVIEQIRAGSFIKLSTSADTLCMSGQNCGQCASSDSHKRDELALSAIDKVLALNLATQTFRLDHQNLTALRNAFKNESVRAACTDCDWFDFCSRTAANNFKQARLQTTSSIFATIADKASKQPKHRALSTCKESLSYAELILYSRRFAATLSEANQLNTSIALIVNNPIKLITAFIGARFCNNNVLVFNPAWPTSQIENCVEQLQPAKVVAGQDLTSIFNEHENSTFKGSCTNTDQLLSTHSINVQTPFYTGFTSGSEGDPKGFCRNELSWLETFKVEQASFTLSKQDTVVCLGSLAHSLFMYACIRGLFSGCTIRFASSADLADLTTIPSTILFAVPAQLQQLVHSKSSLPSCRLLVSGGAKLQPSLRSELKHVLPNAQIFECYGSSELSYIALSDPEDSPPENSVGKPCKTIDVRFVNNEHTIQNPLKGGRLLVKSPMRFLGYASSGNGYEEGPMREYDGYLDSGDTGYLDQQGFLIITGRSDRMINMAGHNISPEQIEAALLNLPVIMQAAVIPLQQSIRGQRPVAVILCKNKASVDRKKLMQHLQEKLPDYAVPRHYYKAHQWPTTVSDKTDFKKIEQLLQQQFYEPL